MIETNIVQTNLEQKLERLGSLGVLTLANPDGNRFGRRSLEALRSIIAEVQASDLGALLIVGDGPAFSYGADVSDLFTLPVEEMTPILQQYLTLIQTIKALPIPTIAAVHGVCSSGGLEFALSCDQIWAAAGTQMGFLEPLLGVLPLAGGVQRIAAMAGPARAFQIATAGAHFGAEDFERWNIVTRVLPADRLFDEAKTYAQALAAGPSLAYRGVKALLAAWDKGGIGAADAAMTAAIQPALVSERAQTTVRGYLQRLAQSTTR